VADNRSVKRTVAFWQFVQAPSLEPMGQIDWPGFMAEIARRAGDSRSRHVVDGTEVTGSVYTRDEVDHLVLTKSRDDMPRQQNRRTGAVEDMITNDEGWVVIESAFIKFLDFGNVFGLLQSQITAPSPQAIARWINQTGILNMHLAVEPVVDPERWNHMREAGGVTALEFAGPSVVLNRPVTGPLDHLLGPARFGVVKVGVKVRASRSRTAEDARERRALYEATEELARTIGVENLDIAKVRIFDEDNKGIRVQTINLIKLARTKARGWWVTRGRGYPVASAPEA
jgi:hypothetical protein